MFQADIQSAIDSAVMSGISITITNFTQGQGGVLTVLIQISSTTQIIDLPSASFPPNHQQSSTPFVCNLNPPPTPKKKRRGRFFGASLYCPNEILVSFSGTPPSQVSYGSCGIYGNPTAAEATNLNSSRFSKGYLDFDRNIPNPSPTPVERKAISVVWRYTKAIRNFNPPKGDYNK